MQEVLTMREILFRGKRIDNGEWVEGFYFERKDTQGKIIEAVIIEDAYEQVTGGQRHIRSDLNRECYRVDPSTVGQYTGRTDKNGKRIFEGDVLHYVGWNGKLNDFCIVVFDFAEFALKFTVMDGQPNPKYPLQRGLFAFHGGKPVFEVIGNIHDNPELLEGGTDNGN